MQFLPSILAAFLASSATVSAGPVLASRDTTNTTALDAALAKAFAERGATPADGHVLDANGVPSYPTYGCMNADWSGECEVFWITANTCLTLNSHWAHTLSSFGPPSSASCSLYPVAGCYDSNGHLFVNYPGYSNLATVGFNDKTVSIFCSYYSPADRK